MKISLVVPNRNNLKYFKWSYDSIRKNQGNHEVWICSAVDACTDGTLEHYEELAKIDPYFKYIVNKGPDRLGHTILYDKIIWDLVETDLAMIFHCDMYLCPNALDAIENLMYGRKLKSFERCELYQTGEYTRGVKLGGVWIYWEDDKEDDIDNPLVHEWLDRWAVGVPKYEFKNKNRVVSLTRIEPPLHPVGPEKIAHDFGTELEKFDERKLLEMAYSLRWNYVHGPVDIRHDFDFSNLPKKSTTTGVFAPWAFWVDEYKAIGGNDWANFSPQSKEDSDIWNRLLLNGTEFLQTWDGFVYHMTCRGSRFNPTITTVGTNSAEWETQNLKSSRNFIRKWGHFVRHDKYLLPQVPHKYDIAAIITNCNYNLLANLELWFSELCVDLPTQQIKDYINAEQPNTRIDLSSKLYNWKSVIEEDHDIICYIDGKLFNGDDFYFVQYLSDIITQNDPEEGLEFMLGTMKLQVNRKKTYEHELIVCKNEPIIL